MSPALLASPACSGLIPTARRPAVSRSSRSRPAASMSGMRRPPRSRRPSTSCRDLIERSGRRPRQRADNRGSSGDFIMQTRILAAALVAAVFCWANAAQAECTTGNNEFEDVYCAAKNYIDADNDLNAAYKKLVTKLSTDEKSIL